MFGRFDRSLRLARESWAILMADKSLLIFPLCSGIGSLLATAAFVIPVFFLYNVPGMMQYAGAGASQGPDARVHGTPLDYALLFLFYLVTYSIVVFFNVGLVSCVGTRLQGGNPTVADGFRFAGSNVGRILAWAVVAATVGTILRAIEDRAEWLGRLVASLLGVVWSLATALVVPVLVFEQVGPLDAVRRSAALLRKTWGETVIGNAGIGLVFGLATLLGIIPIALGVVGGPWGLLAGFLIAVIYWIMLAIVQAALQGIYQTAVYDYAAHGTVPSAFSADLITQAYVPKKR
jgi:Family of unknown function (DUF6159)